VAIVGEGDSAAVFTVSFDDTVDCSGPGMKTVGIPRADPCRSAGTDSEAQKCFPSSRYRGRYSGKREAVPAKGG
jgi:hypothetical protein